MCPEQVYRWWCCWSLLYNAVLRSWADSLRSHVILHEWLAFYSASFEYPPKWCTYSVDMAGATWNFGVPQTDQYDLSVCLKQVSTAYWPGQNKSIQSISVPGTDQYSLFVFPKQTSTVYSCSPNRSFQCIGVPQTDQYSLLACPKQISTVYRFAPSRSVQSIDVPQADRYSLLVCLNQTSSQVLSNCVLKANEYSLLTSPSMSRSC